MGSSNTACWNKKRLSSGTPSAIRAKTKPIETSVSITTYSTKTVPCSVLDVVTLRLGMYGIDRYQRPLTWVVAGVTLFTIAVPKLLHVAIAATAIKHKTTTYSTVVSPLVSRARELFWFFLIIFMAFSFQGLVGLVVFGIGAGVPQPLWPDCLKAFGTRARRFFRLFALFIGPCWSRFPKKTKKSSTRSLFLVARDGGK
jgi:hypothetical protein